jgi:hypothetical protein
VDLVCRTNDDSSTPLIVVAVLCAVAFVACLVVGVRFYRRWAVPGVGIEQWWGCGGTCYPFLACIWAIPDQKECPQDEHDLDQSNDAEMGLLGFDASNSIQTQFGYGVIGDDELWNKEGIGEGSFGLVRRSVLGRRGSRPAQFAAVKELKDNPEADHAIDVQKAMEVLKEGKLMKDIPFHPQVVSLIGVAEKTDTQPCRLVSVLIPNAKELHQYVKTLHLSKKAPDRELLACVLKVLCDAARGLEHLHKHNIVHCDIAPRNILIANWDTAPVGMINDFGLARCMPVYTLCR